MTILICGVLLWSVVHIVPALMPGLRQRLAASLGEGPYKGLFALAIVASLVLIVIGWRMTEPSTVYYPPAWGHALAMVLMFAAVYLFGAAQRPAAIKRYLRHPQLTGLITWASAHLLANGDHRSLILFGGLGVWAIVEILAINHRDPVWNRPAAPPAARELVGVVITLLVLAVLIWIHPWIAGVPLLRG